MKKWLAGILCALIVVVALGYLYITNKNKINYKSDILLKYTYGGGLGEFVDSHTTVITIMSNGNYVIEVPTDGTGINKVYKTTGVITDSNLEKLKKKLQKNDLKKLTNTSIKKDDCENCGFETLEIYYSDTNTYKVNVDGILTTENKDGNEKIFVEIRDCVDEIIPKEKIMLLERLIFEDF